MQNDLPRCVDCRVGIRPGQPVVFRVDRRIQHVECPPVICPVCARGIARQHPIRRSGEELLHASCWIRRYRATAPN